MNYIYMLECGDKSLYTGWTTDISHRVAAHQSGKGAKYTRAHLPVKLVYCETCADKSAALQREIAIKAMTRAQKLALIAAQPAPSLVSL